MRELRHQRSAKINQICNLMESMLHLGRKYLDMIIIMGITMVMATKAIIMVMITTVAIIIEIMMAMAVVMDMVKVSKVLDIKSMSNRVVYFQGNTM